MVLNGFHEVRMMFFNMSLQKRVDHKPVLAYFTFVRPIARMPSGVYA